MSVLAHFSNTEQTEILEIAKLAIESPKAMSYVVDWADLSNEYIEKLRKKIITVMEKDTDNRIAIVWRIEDVIDRAESRDITLTNEQAQLILEQMYKKHDANIGINWDVIDTHIDWLTGENA